MVERVVVWTETAAKQRREILKYWSKRNGSTSFAVKLIKIINDHVQVILKHPESFKIDYISRNKRILYGSF